MSAQRESLPGESARRWLARGFSARAMESVFDPFIADLQADYLGAKANRSALYAKWCVLSGYASLAVQAAACALGSLFGPEYAFAPACGSEVASADEASLIGRLARRISFLCLAFLITFGLFVLMSVLIANRPAAIPVDQPTPIDVVRLKEEPEPPVTPAPELPKRPEIEPEPRVEGISIEGPTEASVISPLQSPTGGAVGAISLAKVGGFRLTPGADADEVPIVMIPPEYPRRALERRIEGWVEVEFTVTETGSVSEPEVIRSHPNRVFDQAALSAIKRWKYEPKVVDGEPVPRSGMRKRLRFELTNNAARSD